MHGSITAAGYELLQTVLLFEPIVRHIAGFAAQLFPDMFLAAFSGRDPMNHCPRRIMTNMLLVTAFELSYPIRVFVGMKSNDFAR